MIKIVSFSYKYGVVPPGSVVFDCRKLPNPHFEYELSGLDGRDHKVQSWLCDKALERTGVFVGSGVSQSDSGKVLAFGCIGGVHRSVAVAEMVAACLRDLGKEVEVSHTALDRGGK